ncbi:GNAT family N-acetyltransferase [Armatimonas sp.]|uniref:GNAT family N-acetyltransferase n=1 Tax=Armatimonas sp. TaxID=1872638 RepID=UPI00286BD17A|nr:GNAT family N-acetyltransferase [Armatimonas sp.]
MTIRPDSLSDADYAARVLIGNTCFPDYVDTVEELRFSDAHRDPKIKWARFLAEVDGQPVATGGYGQSMDMYHPQKFGVNVNVLPEFQGQGIGKALYEHALAALAPHNPILIRSNAREDKERSVRFLTDRGFTEAMRDWESRLALATFDPTLLAEAAQKAQDAGITVHSVAELSKSVPDWKQRLKELDWTITLDMPTTDTLTDPGFEHFEKTTLGNPSFLPDAWFIALDGDHWVGESALWKSEGDPEILYVGATGVRREYRRKGIATALKLAATGWAKDAGKREVRTWNAQENRAMLSINEAMGFEKIPAWISYEKKLQDANP